MGTGQGTRTCFLDGRVRSRRHSRCGPALGGAECVARRVGGLGGSLAPGQPVAAAERSRKGEVAVASGILAVAGRLGGACQPPADGNRTGSGSASSAAGVAVRFGRLRAADGGAVRFEIHAAAARSAQEGRGVTRGILKYVPRPLFLSSPAHPQQHLAGPARFGRLLHRGRDLVQRELSCDLAGQHAGLQQAVDGSE